MKSIKHKNKNKENQYLNIAKKIIRNYIFEKNKII